jgi:hypothetical protein
MPTTGTDTSHDAAVTCASADVVDAAPDAFDADSGCVPALTDTYVPTWIPPNPRSAACTSSQIQMLYDDCVGPTRSWSLCNTFLSQYSNAACDACMEPPIASSPTAPASNGTRAARLTSTAVDASRSSMATSPRTAAARSTKHGSRAKSPPVRTVHRGRMRPAPCPQLTTCAAYQSAAQCTQDPKYSVCFQGSFETLFTTVGAIFCSAD